MIQYSFSPNWYRPQCLSFTQTKTLFYYSSNCIVYKYDLEKKTILSELNIKDWLIKNQAYNLGRVNSQKQQVALDKQSHSVKDSNREKQHGERVLKINCIGLVQGEQGQDILIVGLNCMGLVLIVSSFNRDSHLKVLSTIDLRRKTSPQIEAIEYIHVHQKHVKRSADTNNQQRKEKYQIFDIVLFSLQGMVVNAKLSMGEVYKQGDQLGKVDVGVESWSRLINYEGKKGRYLQVKTITQEQILINNNLINQNETCLLNPNQQSTALNIIFLSHTLQTQIDSSSKSGNIVFYDSNFNKILFLTSVEELKERRKVKKESLEEKEMIANQGVNETILSVDFLKEEDKTKYIVLAKSNHKNKPNPFCQTFHLHTFSSLQLLSSLNENPNSQSMGISTKVEIIYPKKCHHKLSQQQKSTLCVKLINQNYAVMTGRLGEMIILSLKQIQLQLNINPSVTISIRPYSYQEEQNSIYRIQHSQRHYKDIYAIYRTGEQYYNNCNEQNKTLSRMYFIGTDHILTQWQHSTNHELQIHNQNLLKYESSLKFLTASVDQIILSELQPSLVFLRLRDSNIRSFQPYSDLSYWLNQFWKHTNVSFCKKVQKLVMHPKDIGVACLVNDQGKLIFYDLYEQRLIRLISINKKIIQKTYVEGNQNDNKLRKQHNKKLQGNNQQQQREKCIQINSISFQHLSIIQSLQSLYTLHNYYYQQGSDSLKEQFEVKSQQFYEKELDKETVIMIQSNEFILILVEGVKQGRFMRIEVYKKCFKLERIYKTKYWEGNVLVGTRKKKGELMLNVGMRYGEQRNQQNRKQQQNQHYSKEQDNRQSKQLIVKSLQKQIDLPLGISSRYIFKLWEMGVNGRREYILIVINYKGSKLCLVIYSITMLGKQHSIQLNKLIVSEQITIPNFNLSSYSTHQTPINIQNLIISQQPNQFLIGVYSNPTQTITIIDYSQIINHLVNQNETITCEKLLPHTITGELQKIGDQNRQLFTYKRSLNQSQAENNNENEKDIYKNYQKQEYKNNNLKISTLQTLKIEVYQFSGLSYKIQNMMFNSVFCQREMSQISHLIILGKDQSVRLLNLNNHLGENSSMQGSQNMQQGYPYKVHKRLILMKAKIDRNEIKE